MALDAMEKEMCSLERQIRMAQEDAGGERDQVREWALGGRHVLARVSDAIARVSDAIARVSDAILRIQPHFSPSRSLSLHDALVFNTLPPHSASLTSPLVRSLHGVLGFYTLHLGLTSCGSPSCNASYFTLPRVDPPPFAASLQSPCRLALECAPHGAP
eukprot:366505-Chlamydomonas_euryale.AAC.15